MSKLVCKEGVLLKGVTPALAFMFFVLEQLVRKSTYLPDVTITSVYDAKHLANSRHYRGEAIDLRTVNLAVEHKERFRAELENALNSNPIARAAGLGNRFRALIETELRDDKGKVLRGEHIHVQVKLGETFPGV